MEKMDHERTESGKTVEIFIMMSQQALEFFPTLKKTFFMIFIKKMTHTYYVREVLRD
jgi:hypothetical protein